jgi:hypothetical protein
MRRILAGTGLASATVAIAAASIGRIHAVTIAAAVFSGIAIAVAVAACWQTFNWPRTARAPLMPAFVGLLQSSSFAAICYAWGAVTMQGLYLTPVTGLKWQHGWQYALAMALLAAASIAYARSLSGLIRSAHPTGMERQFRWATPLAAAQAIVAGVGLVALWLSGKLFSTRADWAANRVFAALAVAILAVSLASILAQRRLKARPASA